MKQELWKCDKCGAEIRSDGGHYIGYEVSYHGRKYAPMIMEEPAEMEDLELCPRCMRQFKDWVSGNGSVAVK